MKDVRLRRACLSGIAAACSLAVLWLASAALARAPGRAVVTATEGLRAVTSTLASQISYQGALEENGIPVNGTRAMTFTLYADDGCSAALQTLLASTVPVSNGIFTVALDVDQSHFDGQGLWLGLSIEGTELACQEILPVPYALSLRPGAVISGTTDPKSWHPGATTSAILKAQASGAGIGVYGYNLDGYGLRGDGSVGVLGRGHYGGLGVSGWSDYGAGVAGISADGIGVRATSWYSHPLVAQGGYEWPYEVVFVVDNDGDVYADGAYNCGQGDGNDSEPGTCIIQDSTADFAEMLPSALDLESGDVLIIDASGRLARSTEPYQTAVVGVYSADPGYLGGGELRGQEGYAPLAIVGIVPVRATAENGPIQPGDLLASSSTPGHAMLADRFVGGAIIGKALETLQEETGVILMLVMLQ
jgi:hypothetical protein